ncbi:unnamed protein product [Heterosigma akashiwo]|uniref:DUF1995 domain-containing protein n=1 Tax=Heterosigma akashiwo TaxID=2829 RepID=A0A7S3XYD6_HETAK
MALAPITLLAFALVGYVTAFIGGGHSGTVYSRRAPPPCAIEKHATKLQASQAGEEAWAKETYGDEVKVSISNAKNIPEAFHALWESICMGNPAALLFPNCAEIPDQATAEAMLEHLEVAKDSCTIFGTDIVVNLNPAGPCPTFEVKKVVAGGSYGGSSDGATSVGGFNFNFADDDAWDDDWDIDRSLLGEEDGTAAQRKREQLATDEEILAATKEWNEQVICRMGVCPFATSAERAGLPLGRVHYPISRAERSEEIYRDYWAQVALLIDSPPKELSTTLLITPNFGLHNVEGFDMFSNSLTQPLEPLGVERYIQLVFFHPEYCFRDGQDRLGDAGAANYARRSPLPMINILRTDQVRTGQKGIPTGLVYTQNEKTLAEIGVSRLQTMLDSCDWSGLEGTAVDRKAIPYFETARQVTEEWNQRFGIESAPTPPVVAAANPPAPSTEGKCPMDGNPEDKMAMLLQLQERVAKGGSPEEMERTMAAIDALLADM